MPKNQQSPDIYPEIELKIDSMAFGGKGIARHDGKVYFVEDGIEGDQVLASVTEVTDRYNEARVKSIIKPSDFRGPSPCAVSDQCGGCQWQGVPYGQQIVWKRHFVINALRRIGKIGEDIEVDTLPSPLTQGYRNRIFVRARVLRDGSVVAGYFKRSSRDFVPVSRCEIANERINKFLTALKTLSLSDRLTSARVEDEVRFRFEIQDLPTMPDTSPHLLISVYDTDQEKIPAALIANELKSIPGVLWAGPSADLSAAPQVPFETDLGVTFHTAAGQFQQVNIQHNHTVRRLVKDTVESINPDRVLDLFCGSGNLSLPIANGIRHIDGVEFSKRAIDTAKYNVERNNLKNAHYYSGDTEKFLWRAAKQGFLYDLIIADPPREGMFKSLIPLMKLKPKHILYVSCDPTTLSRDLGSLVKHGFSVKRFVALDFFPNTYHIESFVVLERT